jgi:hypothetical protein
LFRLRTAGKVADRDAYRSMHVWDQVNERYGEAIRWLRQQGRVEEARRFELMRRNLPPVRSEKHLIADALPCPRSGAALRLDYALFDAARQCASRSMS